MVLTVCPNNGGTYVFVRAITNPLLRLGVTVRNWILLQLWKLWVAIRFYVIVLLIGTVAGAYWMHRLHAPTADGGIEFPLYPRIPVEMNDAEFGKTVRILALQIYFEARGESRNGQRAVVNVVLNRVLTKGFAGSIYAVITDGIERKKFCDMSWWCDGKSDKPTDANSWSASLDLAYEMLIELERGKLRDQTFGATFYHSDKVTKPNWPNTEYTTTIGHHLFYRLKTVLRS